jgi:hypothetical protein
VRRHLHALLVFLHLEQPELAPDVEIEGVAERIGWFSGLSSSPRA